MLHSTSSCLCAIVCVQLNKDLAQEGSQCEGMMLLLMQHFQMHFLLHSAIVCANPVLSAVVPTLAMHIARIAGLLEICLAAGRATQ